MKTLLNYALILLGTLVINNAYASYGARVAQIAEDYRENLDGKKLYGETFRSSITKDGVLACARVVQIILKKSRVPGFSSALYSVSQIQRKTRSWKKVAYNDIKPGDIVFWRKASHDEICSGGGDCHVGIAVGNGESFDNNGIFKRPQISGISWRLRWRFMYARRMR